MDDIKVSICCITYNHEKYIKDAIESFLMQKTNFNFEILIHDDASTDNTIEIIKEYEIKYPNIIKPYIQETNQYSQGIRRLTTRFNVPRARGKYIALCEGDDYWTDNNKLQLQFDYMEKNNNCGMCFHATEKVYENGERIKYIQPYNSDKKVDTEDVILGRGGFMATNSIFCRTKLLTQESLPNYYHNAPVGDYPLQIYLSTQNYAYYIDKSMSAYRIGVKDSWTYRMKNSENYVEKKVNHRCKTNQMLEELNKETNYKYDLVIKKMKLKNEFEILIQKKNYKKLKSDQYKEIYHSYKSYDKIKLYIRCMFPNFYKSIVKLKRIISN